MEAALVISSLLRAVADLHWLSIFVERPAQAQMATRRRTVPMWCCLAESGVAHYAIDSVGGATQHEDFPVPVAGPHRVGVPHQHAQLLGQRHHPGRSAELPPLHHLVAGRGRHGPVRVLRPAVVGLHHRPLGAVHRVRVLGADASAVPPHCIGDEHLDRGHRHLWRIGHVNSYALLIVGRVLSGAGEASFQCVAPPFIDRHAPPERASLYVGVYLASVFVGEAIGFVYGSAFADSSLTWAGGYYLEAVLMVFLVCCCLFCVPDELNAVPSQDDVALRKSLVSIQDGPEQLILSPASPELMVRKDPFFRAWWGVLSNPPFFLFVLGNGAYTFTLGVFNTYGPNLFVGLGLFGDETSASLVFGIIVAVGGLLGTPLGGYLIDRQTKDTNVPGKRCFVAMTSSFVYVTLAEVFILIMCFLGGAKAAFLACFTVGLFYMCALWGPQMVAILELFPESRRSLAISANAVIIHIFGDVPAPTVMGVVWDAWAPNCGSVEGSDGDAELNPRCSEDQDGLKSFMLLSTLWMLWAVLLWALAAVAIKRRQMRGGFLLTTAADY